MGACEGLQVERDWSWHPPGEECAGDRNKGAFTSSFVAVPMAIAPRRRPHGCKHVMDVSLSSGRDVNAGFHWSFFFVLIADGIIPNRADE